MATRQLLTDVVIVNGDGRTAPYEGDVLIDGDRIVQLGDVGPSGAGGADRVIEGRGRVLAPGFVDTHNHGALGGTRIGEHGIPVTCEMALRGGVTKRICGSDGLAPAPVLPSRRGRRRPCCAAIGVRADRPGAWLVGGTVRDEQVVRHRRARRSSR